MSSGKLKEESHYYPFVLPIGSMGSAAAGFKENKHKYQSNEYNKELGLNWMNFQNRQYDPQLGRFLSIDPLAAATPTMSPYTGMNNDPVNVVDPLGLEGIPKDVTRFYGPTEIMPYGGRADHRPGANDGMNDAENFGRYSGAVASLMNLKAAYNEAIEMCYGGQQSSSTQGASQIVSNDGISPSGVDYVHDGKTLSDKGEANGLNNNRIVKKNKKGEIKESININKTKIKKSDFGKGKGEVFDFQNAKEMVVDIWIFLALNSNNEWSLTEFKYKGINTVFSRITTSYKTASESVGLARSKEFELKGRPALEYWGSAHSHGNGLSGLSTPQMVAGNKSDTEAFEGIQTLFSNARMEAYNYQDLDKARIFLQFKNTTINIMSQISKFTILLFLVCVSLIPKSAKSQSDEKCFPIVDTLNFPQLTITDSTFAKILDSAISLIKAKPARGYTIPYLMELYPGKAKGTQRYVELNAHDVYGIEVSGKEAWYDIHQNYMFIQQGKYQVLVDTSEFKDSWFSEYLKPANVTGQYYAYGFYMSEDKSITCDFVPPTIQEVTFQLWPRKPSWFTFEKYVLRVIN